MSTDQSTKLFNTAIIATKLPRNVHQASKLNELVRTPAFRKILEAIQQFSMEQRIPEEQAAEEVIQVFRDVDDLWDSYIFQEGLEKLKSHLGDGKNSN